MPFHLRKSASAGPFRFNFSRGGVGVSVGVRGLRFGTGPRGHYVHAGRGGVYYRTTIRAPGERTTDAPTRSPRLTPDEPREDHGVDMVEIESGDVLAMRDEGFGELLDDINNRRRRISMGVMLAAPVLSAAALATLAAPAVGGSLALLTLLAWMIGTRIDSYRRTCVLFYELDEHVENGYAQVVAAFHAMARCAGRWHVEAGGAVRDLVTWKRNAGATHIVRRTTTSLTYALPRGVTCNVTPPALHVGRQVIHLLPDVALVDDGATVGAVSYERLAVAWQDSNFIEDGAVPVDAEVIGYTWKHPNKSGGPDRRFRDNRQIPVCRYEVMHLTSPDGLNELVEFSQVGVAGPFARALRAMPTNRVDDAPALVH